MREELQMQFQSAKTKLSILVFKTTTTIQLLTINSASEMQIAWHGYLDWLNVCLSQLQFSGQAPWATAEGPGIGKLFCSGHKMDSCHRIQLDSAGFGSSVRIRKEVWVLAAINFGLSWRILKDVLWWCTILILLPRDENLHQFFFVSNLQGVFGW